MKDDLYFLAQYLVMSLDGLSTGIMMEMILTARNRNRCSRWCRPLCFWFMVLLICLPSYLMHYKILPIVNLGFTIAGTVFLILFLYESSLRQALFLFALYFLILFLGEIALLVCFPAAYASGVD